MLVNLISESPLWVLYYLGRIFYYRQTVDKKHLPVNIITWYQLISSLFTQLSLKKKFEIHKWKCHNVLFVCFCLGFLWVFFFNYISAILWRSYLLVEETRVPAENHRPIACHWQTLSHKCCIDLAMNGVRTHTSVVIGIDCIDSLYGEHLTFNMHYIELYIVCMMLISYISSLIFLN